jgi:hypothetical protein
MPLCSARMWCDFRWSATANAALPADASSAPASWHRRAQRSSWLCRGARLGWPTTAQGCRGGPRITRKPEPALATVDYVAPAGPVVKHGAAAVSHARPQGRRLWWRWSSAALVGAARKAPSARAGVFICWTAPREPRSRHPRGTTAPGLLAPVLGVMPRRAADLGRRRAHELAAADRACRGRGHLIFSRRYGRLAGTRERGKERETS